ncbi:MAG: twin-arginine translocation signal domain-containing protein [Kiritimatiellae bacterium]|nr:twin-arginine translocation signal domain-containing protein [Kiritimatiellia bacterium]
MQTSRRDFLLGGAAVAVGAVVPPVATLADAQ